MDYASNSKKDREKSEKLEKKEVVEQVVTGTVIEKPKGIGYKFKTVFLGGDAKQVAMYVSTDVILPAVRNLIVDMVTKGMENLVYGNRGYGRRGPSINYSTSRFSDPRYASPISRPYDSARPSFAPPALPRGRQNRHDMNDIILETREEADIVIERLDDILSKYDVASLADLNAMLGLEGSHIDNKWGWTNLAGSGVRQTRQGFLLDLPPLEEI